MHLLKAPCMQELQTQVGSSLVAELDEKMSYTLHK